VAIHITEPSDLLRNSDRYRWSIA